ncbi:Protein of unknown function [Pyronema omphalodes CBS 100304]|uniref:Uncharacterized protein n=1 Tax=Pyronema omphalodes (strain CBS 100304) TaxID=1076935 RepID=U4KXI5_PYROM|nr:Protein of unknown function [Pyronema omphalodes CBS 100304]
MKYYADDYMSRVDWRGEGKGSRPCPNILAITSRL